MVPLQVYLPNGLAGEVPAWSFYTNSGGAMVVGDDFRLDQLPNYTEFTALFDQYKIVRVKTRFSYDRTEAAVNSSLTTITPMPNLVIVNDFDDGQFMTDEQAYLQYESLKIHQLSSPFTHYCSPLPSAQVYQSTLATGYSTPNVAPWIDVGSPSVPHYGIKWAIDPIECSGTGEARLIGRITLYHTVTVALRNVK